MSKTMAPWKRVHTRRRGALHRAGTRKFAHLIRLHVRGRDVAHRAHLAFAAEIADGRALLVSLDTPAGRRKAVRAALPLLAYAIAWFVAFQTTSALAFALSPKISGPAPLCFQDAVTIAALLLTPVRRWWRYLLLIIPLTVLYFWWLGIAPSPAILVLLVANWVIIGGIALLTVSLLHRFVAAPVRFAGVGEISRFLACSALAAIPAALLATALSTFVFSWTFWSSWQVAYLGHVLGIATFTPAIVLWLRDGLGGLDLTTRRRQMEAGLLLLTTVGVGAVAFGTQLTDPVIADALIYAVVPVLIWAAVRFDPQGLASILALATLIATTGAVNTRGPFVEGSAASNVVALQLYLLFVGVPLFFLAALVQERKQSAAALHASEARYRGVVESQTEMITRYLPDTTVTFVNEANCRAVGRSREQIVGSKFVDVLVDNARESTLAMVHSLLAHSGVVTLEHQVLLADGRLAWQQWVNQAILDDQGRVVELQGIGRDITERKQMELALNQRVAELEAVLEAVPDILVVYDSEGRVVMGNRALNEVIAWFHARPDTLKETASQRAARLDGILHLDGTPLLEAEWPVTRVLRGEVLTGSDAIRMVVHMPGGDEVIFSVTGAPLRDGSGRITGAVCVQRDISERVRLEREVSERAEQLDRLFEQMADGVALYNARGHLVRMNPAQRRLEGWDAAGTLPSNPVHPSLPERMALFGARDEDDRPLAVDDGPLPRAVRGDAAEGGETMDLRARMLDGRLVDLSVSAATLRDRDGNLAGAVAVFRDQTEQKRLERERAEQAEQLDRIFEGITDGLVAYDAQGRIVRSNPAARRILGLDAISPDYGQQAAQERALLYSVRDEQDRPLTPDDWPLVRVLRGEAASGADARDVRMRTPDGRELEVTTSSAALRDGQGRLVGAVTILHDRTERRRLERERDEARAGEQAMRALNEQMDTFVAMAAHDLRNPIAVSRRYLDVARHQVDLAATHLRGAATQQAAYLVQAAGGLATTDLYLDRLSRLLRQLLDVSRISQGTLVLKHAPMNLVDLVVTAVADQRLLTPSRVLDLNLQESAGPTDSARLMVVDADADRIGQVLSNYLSNAVRYSPEDQPIAVTLDMADASGGTEQPSGATAITAEDTAKGAAVGTTVERLAQPAAHQQMARVEVRDQGRGIPLEEQQRIWERFQRLGSVRHTPGLGLGLYIVRTIVELHGGQVGVESVTGQGSTFWFTLPLIAAQE